MSIFAIVTSLDAARFDVSLKEHAVNSGLKEGDKILVTAVDTHMYYSDIYLNGFEKPFYSHFFSFEEEGVEVDIRNFDRFLPFKKVSV